MPTNPGKPEFGWGEEAQRALGAASACAVPDSHPALELAQSELPDHQHAGRAVVEAGNGGEIRAALLLEDVRVLDRDLLERLETVGGKAGRDHHQVLHPLLGQPLDGAV